jgi:hypothetical protein
VEALGRKSDLSFGPREVIARPPGVFFSALLGPLTLADVQAARMRKTPVEYATSAHVRRLAGRWEIFFECRRPAPPLDANAPTVPDEVEAVSDLRGVEAVTLLLGADDQRTDGGPRIWLTVPETGYWRVLRGINDGTLQVHRRSYSDRWNCRIVVPDAWFGGGLSNAVQLGCVRSHGDSDQLETAPSACLPWRPAPARARIVVDRWDDVPRD